MINARTLFRQNVISSIHCTTAVDCLHVWGGDTVILVNREQRCKTFPSTPSLAGSC